MAKSRKEKGSEPSGTPNYIMASVLFALIVFALEGLKESIGFGQARASLRDINLAFFGLGLALCFFWRRFHEGFLKQIMALSYTLGLWAYLILMVLGPILFRAEEGRILFIHQFGFGTVLLVSLSLLANIFYDTRLVPSLMGATLAGLVTCLASLWSLVPLAQSSKYTDDILSDFRQDGESEIHASAYGDAHGESQDVDQLANEGKVTKAHKKHEQAIEDGDDDHDETVSPISPERARQKLVGRKPLVDDEEEDELAFEENARRHPRAHGDKGKGSRGRHLNTAIDQDATRSQSRTKQELISSKGQSKQSGQSLKAKLKPTTLGETAHSTAGHPSVHWDYKGADGPDAWGSLDAAFRLCENGQQQSPIDIPNEWPLQDDLELQYKASAFDAIDNGHTVQYNLEPGNNLILSGKRYELKKILFHSPSEHFIGGRSSILEAHFVHASASGDLLVLGSMIEAGLMNREYQKLWDFMPFSKNEGVKPRGKTVDPRELLPAKLSVFRYAGSLTTPPCSEKVIWNVLKDKVQMSQEQINRFREKYRNNARPIQSNHERQ